MEEHETKAETQEWGTAIQLITHCKTPVGARQAVDNCIPSLRDLSRSLRLQWLQLFQRPWIFLEILPLLHLARCPTGSLTFLLRFAHYLLHSVHCSSTVLLEGFREQPSRWLRYTPHQWLALHRLPLWQTKMHFRVSTAIRYRRLHFFFAGVGSGSGAPGDEVGSWCSTGDKQWSSCQAVIEEEAWICDLIFLHFLA
jgi:hypothetical protein